MTQISLQTLHSEPLCLSKIPYQLLIAGGTGPIKNANSVPAFHLCLEKQKQI